MTCEGVVKVSVPPRAAEVIAAGVKTVAAARVGVGRAAATMEVKMVQETEVISVRRRWGNPEVTSAEVEMMEARAAVVVRVERATPGSRVAQGTRLAAAGNGAPRQWARRVPVTLCWQGEQKRPVQKLRDFFAEFFSKSRDFFVEFFSVFFSAL
jgi:hypothetical protein